MKTKIIRIAVALCCAAVVFITACTPQKPKAPISLTVWHYYSSAQQRVLLDLIAEFNETVGTENNIVVEACNKGSLNDIRNAVTQSSEQYVGSDNLPNIFSAYADTAYEFYNKGIIADIAPYISEDIRSKYIPEYLNEGTFAGGDSIMLWPIAKSTEVFMINTTDWEPFAKAYGVSTDSFATWEGITEISEKYYNYTDSLTGTPNDGKAFFGRDSMANYIIIGSLQLGHELFKSENGKVSIQLDRAAMRKLWDNYYVPYVKGHFTAQGRFRSDDAKTGDIIALVGSTSSTVYCPDFVTRADGTSYSVNMDVYPVPNFEGYPKYAVQQGAGMAVVKSDEATERAAAMFLSWLTEPEQNLQLTAFSGYLPVRSDANDTKLLSSMVEQGVIKMSAITADTIASGMFTSNNYRMYTNGAFKNSYELRQVVETSMQAAADADRKAVIALVNGGMPRIEALKAYITDKRFEEWFTSFSDELNAV